MPDETLLLLAKDVRGKTLRILEGVTEQQARYTPPGLQNHILWHAGHSLVVVEFLAAAPATGQPPSLSQDWCAKFDWNSKPATVKDWPKLAEVIDKLVNQLERITTAIPTLSQEKLSQPTGDPARSRSYRSSILHGFHDEANHQGEMWLLKKMIALPK